MGNSLVQSLLESTGLPQGAIEREFACLVEKHGKPIEQLDVEDLRAIVAEYLQLVFLELHQENSAAS